LIGGVGTDAITLGDTANTITVSGIDTLTGGASTDIVFTGAAGVTMTASGVEYLVGGTGSDDVTLGASGNTVITRGIDTMIGGAGSDLVILGDTGVTMRAESGIEIIVGGAATDVVSLGNGGSTVLLRGIETLIGGTGNDVITTGNTGVTMSVSGVETLIGGSGTDAISVTSGSIRFQGGTGDSISLASGSGTDTVVYSSFSDIASLGANTGFISVSNFQSGTDKVQLTDVARTTADKNGDAALATATAATNGVSMTNELVSLSSAVSGSLTDASLANFRTALGTLTNSSAGASTLVLANNGTSSALYQVVDTDGNGQVAATEVRLLGVYNSTVLSLSDINLG
jgi:Ca2+-binding RTX toxin-like protein